MSMDVRIVHRVRSGEREFQLDVAFKTGHKRVALFGPSGAGKSMTVQAIAGLIRPQDGHIVFNGRVLFDAARRVCLPAQRRKVAYLFQDYALFPHLTVAQNISFGLETGWRNPSRKWLPRAARQWVDAFELDAVVGSYPAELSGGQQQRVALARALAVEPDILLLDEPLAALDAMLRKKMRAELAALRQRLDIPMIVITHDPDDVHALADHVVAIDNGKKAGEFAASELPVQGLFTPK